MYKVFYKDRTVFFIESDQKIIDGEKTQIHHFKNKEQLKTLLHGFQNNFELQNLYIVDLDIDFAFKIFTELYTLIEAAGGLVKTPDGKLLFIFRRNKWDLPKGKIELKEKPKSAAIREVEEECGIQSLRILHHLKNTYHVYTENNCEILKRTYWYEMLHDGNQKPSPQTEEEITETKWFRATDLDQILSNTFPSIIEVLKKANIHGDL